MEYMPISWGGARGFNGAAYIPVPWSAIYFMVDDSIMQMTRFVMFQQLGLARPCSAVSAPKRPSWVA